MSYHKVIYEKLFPYAPYLNERIGLEILIETGQDPMEAFEDAWQKVHAFRNKHIQDELAHQYEPIPEIQVDKEQITVNYEAVIEEIKKSKNIEELKQWQKIAFANTEAIKAYTEKLKSFKK